jgi:excisionase family DNA binding protein
VCRRNQPRYKKDNLYKMESDTDIMTVKEAAAWLRVNHNTIYDQIRRKELPALHIGKRVVRLLRSDVVEWARSRRCGIAKAGAGNVR